MAEKMQIFDYDGLVLYDGLLKGIISNESAKALKTVVLDGRTLKFYNVSEPVGETVPVYAIELPESDLSGLIPKLTAATAGNVITAKDDGTVQDSGIAISSLATKTDISDLQATVDKNSDEITRNSEAISTLTTKVETVESTANAAKDTATEVQNDVKELKDTIGDVPDGSTVMGIIKNIQENGYDDTALTEKVNKNASDIAAITTRVDTVESKTTTLIGEDTNKSVREIANEELAKQLVPEGAKESLDTLTEIAAWIQSHPDDAAAMNEAIEALEKLVGTLPEGITATTVVGYVQELVAAEKTRAEGVASGENGSITTAINEAKEAAEKAQSDVDALTERVTTAEGKIATLEGKVSTAEATITEHGTKLTALEASVNSNSDAISALQDLVGDGVEAISEDKIRALFA